MQYIYDWVTQIIVFIFIGTIVQMILPSNQFRKYVEIVFGLFLLLLLLQPVISFMNLSLDVSLEKIEANLFPEKIKENMNINGLDSERDAYIWKETKTVLMEQANEQLDAEQIYEMEWQVDGEQLEEVIVYMEEKELEEDGLVENIVINGEDRRDWQEDEDALLSKQLQQIWEFDEVPIKIKRGRRLR